MVTIHLTTETRYSLNPFPSSAIQAALRGEGEKGFLQFFKDGDLKDENPWFVALLNDGGETIAISSISALYHEGCVAEVGSMSPIYVDLDLAVVEDVHEFLVNNGEKPSWWKEVA